MDEVQKEGLCQATTPPPQVTPSLGTDPACALCTVREALSSEPAPLHRLKRLAWLFHVPGLGA